jgi:RNA polymerase-interacting CarD/CdnL/TRCF family regulator
MGKMAKRKKKDSDMAFDFKVGETVVEPTVGICQLEGIRRMEVDGKEENYYIFKASNSRVLVPRSQIDKRGIRRPMTKDDVKKIFTFLKIPVSPTRNDARLQYMSYRNVMKSGEPQKITKLLRDLYTLDQADELKGKEREIMDQARRFLCDEISYVRQISKTTVMERINESLRTMYKKKMQKEKEKAKKQSLSMEEFEDTEVEEEDLESGAESAEDEK